MNIFNISDECIIINKIGKLSKEKIDNLKDINGNTLLHHAILHDYRNLILFLLNIYKANNNSEALLQFTIFNKIKSLLLDNNADVNGVSYINMVNYNDETPLQVAIFKKNFDRIKLLLDNGVDVNQANNNGDTPLHFVISLDNNNLIVAMTKLLLKYNADVNKVNNNGKTPLHIIFNKEFNLIYNEDLRKKYSDVIKLLLVYGADINIQIKGNTLLNIEIIKKNDEIVELLIENGADVNQVSSGGNTPLHTAVLFNNYKVVKLLLENGAYINIKNNDDKTPLRIAKFKNDNIINILKYYQ